MERRDLGPCGGSFHLRWDNPPMHSIWGSLDDLLVVQKQMGGTLEPSKDHKEPYSVLITLDDFYVQVFSQDSVALEQLAHTVFKRLHAHRLPSTGGPLESI
jgi:hypothetical protein